MRGWTLAFAALLVAAPVAFGAATPPTLRLTSTKPLVVSGAHFGPRERVHVTISAEQTRFDRRLSADPAGAFVVKLPRVAISRCEGVSGRAVGASGRIAYLKRPPLPACNPDRSQALPLRAP